MGKTPKDFESGKAQLAEVKANLKEARQDLNAFLKENKLKRNEDHSGHKTKKIASGYKKRVAAIDKLTTQRDDLTTWVKENKPKKERKVKYAYPDGADANERKKFRAKARASAKKAGVEVDEYLSDPDKYDKQIASKKKEAKPKKAAKGKSSASNGKAKGTAKKKVVKKKKAVAED